MGIIFALLAVIMIGTGMVFQKYSISTLGNLDKKSVKFYLRISIWILGFILVNMSIVANYFALKYISPSIVSSFYGVTLIVVLFEVNLFFRVKIDFIDYFVSFVLLVSIALLKDIAHDLNSLNYKKWFMFFYALFPFILFSITLSCKSNSLIKKYFIFLLAFVAGFSGGIIFPLMKICQINNGEFSILYFHDLYFYLYLLNSLISFLALQIAYKFGNIVYISPIQFSSAVIFPALISYHVFFIELGVYELFLIFLITFATLYVAKRNKEIKFL